jgi:riboflavin synthase
VNTVGTDWFNVALIPHTIAATTFAQRHAGDTVNIEVDVIARYVERLSQTGNGKSEMGNR